MSIVPKAFVPFSVPITVNTAEGFAIAKKAGKVPNATSPITIARYLIVRVTGNALKEHANVTSDGRVLSVAKVKKIYLLNRSLYYCPQAGILIP